jgi:AraC-like DNA-binding protein
MKEIAWRLGFDEPAHFSKFFKMNCGKSFRDFKRSHARPVTSFYEEGL